MEKICFNKAVLRNFVRGVGANSAHPYRSLPYTDRVFVVGRFVFTPTQKVSFKTFNGDKPHWCFLFWVIIIYYGILTLFRFSGGRRNCAQVELQFRPKLASSTHMSFKIRVEEWECYSRFLSFCFSHFVLKFRTNMC